MSFPALVLVEKRKLRAAMPASSNAAYDRGEGAKLFNAEVALGDSHA